MSAKTKIVVLRMKELIYAGIFAAIGLILVILMALMFLPGRDRNATSAEPPVSEEPDSINPPVSPTPRIPGSGPISGASSQAGILQESVPASAYVPGIYKTELVLGGQTIEVEAVLEKDHISSLRLVNLDEAVTTMYPLLQPTMDSICEQVYETQSLTGITYNSGAKYTSLVLLEAIRNCLDKAAVTP